MSNVIPLNPELVGDGATISPDDVLNAAIGKLDVAVVVGIEEDGSLYLAASHGSETSHFLMARASALLVHHDVLRS